jgi:predicted nucleic acid-binding protein
MAIERVYMDSNCFIESVQSQPDSASPHANDLWFIRKLMEAARNLDIEIVTSQLTIAEFRGIGGGAPPPEELKRLISSILTSGKVVKLAQMTLGIAEAARDLHWVHGINLGGADAIHVATAKVTGCREFLSLDFGKSRSPIHNASAIRNAIGLTAVVPSGTTVLPPRYLQLSLQ